jgi:tetratricopeptide (TPR) repeat protein
MRQTPAAAAETREGDPALEDNLRALSEKSLLCYEVDAAGSARVSTLETIREYASERLVARGAWDAARIAHAAYYAALVSAAGPFLEGREQQLLWLGRLDRDHANLLAALEWTVRAADGEAALQFVHACYPFWNARGYFSEGRRWTEAVLARPLEPSVLRATVCSQAGVFASRLGDHARAIALEQQALETHRALSNDAGVAMSLLNLGVIAHRQNDLDRAERLLSESVAGWRRLDVKRSLGMALYNLGSVMYLRADYARAEAYFGENVELRRAIGDQSGIAFGLHGLGWVALQRGELQRAHELFAESLRMDWQIGNQLIIAHRLEGLGFVATARQQGERGARLYGAADALRQAAGSTVTASERAPFERNLALLRGLLGDSGFAAAWAAGRGLSVSQAVAYALEQFSI